MSGYTTNPGLGELRVRFVDGRQTIFNTQQERRSKLYLSEFRLERDGAIEANYSKTDEAAPEIQITSPDLDQADVVLYWRNAAAFIKAQPNSGIDIEGAQVTIRYAQKELDHLRASVSQSA